MGYTIRVSAADGYNATFASATAAHNNGYFVAYKMNGVPLDRFRCTAQTGWACNNQWRPAACWRNIAKISLEGLPDQYPSRKLAAED